MSEAQQPITAPDSLLSPLQAAQQLGISPLTLANWRATKRYPLPYIKVGGRVRYARSDLDAFLASRRSSPEKDPK